MPVSLTRRVPSPVSSGGSTTTRAGACGSAARRAVIASTAFCNNSRTYTRGLAYRWWLSRSTTPRRSTWKVRFTSAAIAREPYRRAATPRRPYPILRLRRRWIPPAPGLHPHPRTLVIWNHPKHFGGGTHMRTFSVRVRLIAGFGLVLAAVAVLAVVGYAGFGTQLAASTGVQANSALTQRALQVKYQAADWNGWQTGYAFDIVRGVPNAASDT